MEKESTFKNFEKGDEEEKMNLTGVQLACRYSSFCEHAKYYGLEKELEKFSFSVNGEERAKKILKKLETQKYYEEIARVNNIDDPFDFRVVSYYWRGSPKLKGGFWHNLTTLLPIVTLPLDKVSIQMVDECMVNSGVITGISSMEITVKYTSLEKKQGVGIKRHKRPELKRIKNPFFLRVKRGDIVTFHFSNAIEKITLLEAMALNSITNRSLKKFNELRARNKV